MQISSIKISSLAPWLFSLCLFACEQKAAVYESGPLVGVQKSTAAPPAKLIQPTVVASSAPTSKTTEPQEQGDPEPEEETPGITITPPEEVPLAGTTFDAKDSLSKRVTKWKAATGKTKFKKKIVIEKSKRVLTIYADDDPIIRYPVELGFAPAGDKEFEGDGKTPEGEMYVCSKNKASKFHRFLGLSYPQPDDAERGFAEKMITAKQRDQILYAHKVKGLPSWSTKLGGAVGIHGGGQFYEAGSSLLGYDWTLGCIALTNEASEAIFDFAEFGTHVVIYK
jgi:lipoprotein-anchoring transpeptidase ErfK/SrfK